MKNKFLLATVSLLLSFSARAQSIENVRFYTEKNREVHIYYDLTGAAPGQRFEVWVEFTNDKGSNWYRIQRLSGAVGSGVEAGSGKQIIWKVLDEYGAEGVQSLSAAFRVHAKVSQSGNNSSSGTQPPPTTDFGIEMVFVKGGSFDMGCTGEQGSDCYSNESPKHRVRLSDYYIGKYEVTQAQWEAVMGSNPSYFKCPTCPVESVRWTDAQKFIARLNARTGKSYRLPTEAEWEYAARGGAASKGYKYAGSTDNIGEVAWYDANSKGKTQPVQSKKPNELGLYHMSGNVWEWCQDWYGVYKEDYQPDPKGPPSGPSRVLRGGSWSNDPRGCRVSDRICDAPSVRNYYIGFRLALSP